MDPYNTISSLFFNWVNGEINEGVYLYINCVLTVDVPTEHGIVHTGTHLTEIQYDPIDLVYYFYINDIEIGSLYVGSDHFVTTIASAINLKFNAGVADQANDVGVKRKRL